MSIRAGSIVTVAGRNVVDRLQDAGIQNAQVPLETIREVGNDLVVDKIATEAEFTFQMTSWDVTTDLMAFLHGKVGNQVANQPPGYLDPEGTQYRWEDCQFVNVTSPWKTDTGNAGGHIGAGVIIPGYYPTQLRYRFGITEWANAQVDLVGGSYYFAQTPPVEEYATGDGATTAYVTSESARCHRLGGGGGTTFREVFGVLVNGVLQVENVDYTVTTAGVPPASSVATIHFAVAPANNAPIRFCYFTETAKTYPQAVNADATIKPGAVRGRDIVVLVGARASNEVQHIAINATGGTWTASQGALGPTAAIAWNATTGAVEEALELILGEGTVEVSGAPGDYTITFTGPIEEGLNVAALTTDPALLTGGAMTAVVTTPTPGGVGGSRVRLTGVQTFELTATITGTVDREMGNSEITGRNIEGTDVTGTVTIRSKDIATFTTQLAKLLGVNANEVFGYINSSTIPVEIQIRNPKNNGETLKTIYVPDGLFQPPGTPARVNQPTDFAIRFDSQSGTFSEFKGARP